MIKTSTLLLLTQGIKAVTLKTDSYSAEQALAELGNAATGSSTCMCFEFDSSEIEGGGRLVLPDSITGECDASSMEFNVAN